jgi:hypothetical protein
LFIMVSCLSMSVLMALFLFWPNAMLQVVKQVEEARRVKRRTSSYEEDDDDSEVCLCCSNALY